MKKESNMKIIVETKKDGKQSEETIVIVRGHLGTQDRIAVTIKDTTYFLDPYIFDGLLMP